MSKYSSNDFKVGDKVYHLSNKNLIMVAIEVNDKIDEISCRWIDKSGLTHTAEFISQELGKVVNSRPKISKI